MPPPRKHAAKKSGAKEHPREASGLSAARIVLYLCAFIVVVGAVAAALVGSNFFPISYQRADADVPAPKWPANLNTSAYNVRMLMLAHVNVASTTLFEYRAASTTASTTAPAQKLLIATTTATTSVSLKGRLWPTSAPYPQGGAILPFHRIVAYYGNFYSKKMGVLGEYDPATVMAKLASTTKEWAKADPATPVIPAIQYIAVVAQGQAGADGKWRARMPDSQIDKALGMANQMHGLLILDIQVGQSTLEQELPLLEKYLKLSNVELAIDPEFAMPGDEKPGIYIGTLDATQINYAARYLASLVDKYHLPPKVLVVHRFTYDMVTHPADIQPLPEVEVVMDMDGWGSQARKINTYTHVIAPYPVQFTGLKLFYHADLKPPSTGMLTPSEVLGLTPSPIYIQYQ